MISTYSKFLYGYTIDSTNYGIDFKEGSTSYLAEINVGSYTATTICQAIADAMNAAGAYTYSCSFNRSTRKFTITGSSAFTLLCNTGTHSGVGAWATLGFATGSDTSSATTHTSDNSTGTLYTPQLFLQDFISSDDYQQSVDATINKSASGKVEVYRVGTEKFCQFSIKYITNRTMSGAIKNNATGVSDARSFMQFITQKNYFEFMPDENDMATFQTLILETTPQSSTGTGYMLDEQYSRGMAGVYETGKLKMRLIE